MSDQPTAVIKQSLTTDRHPRGKCWCAPNQGDQRCWCGHEVVAGVGRCHECLEDAT